MVFSITYHSFPLFIGISFIFITLSKVWGFKRNNSLLQVSRRLKWIMSFVYLVLILIITLVVFLATMLLLNHFIPDPNSRIKLLNRLGFIVIPFAGFFDWFFDPWPKFIKQNQGEVEYLYPPKLEDKKAGE